MPDRKSTFQHVSAAPTNPRARPQAKTFDVAPRSRNDALRQQATEVRSALRQASILPSWPVLNRLGHVCRLDRVRPGEVGDGAGEFEDTVEGARGKL